MAYVKFIPSCQGLDSHFSRKRFPSMMAFGNIVSSKHTLASVELIPSARARRTRNLYFARASRTLVLTSATLLFALGAALPPAAAQTPRHPLDGLTAPEYWTSYEVLQASGKVNAKTRYPLVQLKE